MNLQFSSLDQFEKAFPDEAACVAHLAAKRWAGSTVCPYCDHSKCYELKGATKKYKCGSCRRLFSVKVGTIFEDSNLPLRVWFRAIYFATNSPKGVSSVTLAKFLGRPQKTAWHMLTKIRVILQATAPEILDGEVEVDEVYHGGLEKNKHAHKRVRNGGGVKTPIMGMVQRGGPLKLQAIADGGFATINSAISSSVQPGASIYTDDHQAYAGLSKRGHVHEAVKHGRREYVRVTKDGTLAHTNTVEGAFSLFRRTVTGTYHYISTKHLQKYCFEVAYRYNHRKATMQERFDGALIQAEGRTITYAQIIAKA